MVNRQLSKRVSADQCHMTEIAGLGTQLIEEMYFLKLSADKFLSFLIFN